MDADPRVAHGEEHLIVARIDEHGDAAFLRKLDGIPNEVHEDAFEARLIHPRWQHARFGKHLQEQALFFCERFQRTHDPLGLHDHVEFDGLHVDHVRLQAGHVEEGVDGVEQPLTASLNHRGKAAQFPFELFLQHVCEAENRRERRSQLVGGIGEEVVLQLVGLVEALVGLTQPGVRRIEPAVNGLLMREHLPMLTESEIAVAPDNEGGERGVERIRPPRPIPRRQHLEGEHAFLAHHALAVPRPHAELIVVLGQVRVFLRRRRHPIRPPRVEPFEPVLILRRLGVVEARRAEGEAEVVRGVVDLWERVALAHRPPEKEAVLPCCDATNERRIRRRVVLLDGRVVPNQPLLPSNPRYAALGFGVDRIWLGMSSRFKIGWRYVLVAPHLKCQSKTRRWPSFDHPQPPRLKDILMRNCVSPSGSTTELIAAAGSKWGWPPSMRILKKPLPELSDEIGFSLP